jgi:hypothetical protein
MLVSNSLTGEAFVPDCRAYACPHCGWIKVRQLANGIAAWFNGKVIRMLTLTTTNRFNDVLKAPLPTLAWRQFAKNLRNYKAFRGYKNVQYVRLVEYQKNGNPHFHILVNRFLPRAIIERLWFESVRQVLFDNGITVDDITKVSNAHLVGELGGAKKIIRYVVKYVTKGVQEFSANKATGERYRPYSASREVHIWPTKTPAVGWKVTFFHELYGEGLYSSSICLMPKLVDEKWKVCLTPSAYSIIHGEDFDYG